MLYAYENMSRELIEDGLSVISIQEENTSKQRIKIHGTHRKNQRTTITPSSANGPFLQYPVLLPPRCGVSAHTPQSHRAKQLSRHG